MPSAQKRRQVLGVQLHVQVRGDCRGLGEGRVPDVVVLKLWVWKPRVEPYVRGPEEERAEEAETKRSSLSIQILFRFPLG